MKINYSIWEHFNHFTRGRDWNVGGVMKINPVVIMNVNHVAMCIAIPKHTKRVVVPHIFKRW